MVHVPYCHTSSLNQGWQVWLQSGSDWPQMGQIRGFFRSDFRTFGSSTHFGAKPTIPALDTSYLRDVRIGPSFNSQIRPQMGQIRDLF